MIRRRNIRGRKGFTLFEIVVVLSIIVVLGTMGMIGYQASVPPGAVNAARNEFHGLLRYTREQAIIRGTNAMLIVNYDKTDAEKFLRYVGVIVEEEIGSGYWLAAHSGVYLPRGIYFVPQGIGDPVTDGFAFESIWPVPGTIPADMRSEYYCTTSLTGNAIGTVEYPVRQPVLLDAAGEPKWIGYQFGPDGHTRRASFNVCSGAPFVPNNHIVLGFASIQPDGTLLFEGSDKTVGIVLRTNGISFAVNDSNAL